MTLHEFCQRAGGGAKRGALLALAAGLAYLPTHSLGLRQEFWASITAILVLQTELRAVNNMARNQALGALIGGAVGLALILGFGDSLDSYLASVLISALICHALAIEGASQLAGVTVTILMLVPHTETPVMFWLARVSEVAWGTAVGAAIAWVALGKVRKAP
jgi:uncharacterized membrane protein YgaE (UPF0421/DUF939 family)